MMIGVFLATVGSSIAFIAYCCGIRRNVTLDNIKRAFPNEKLSQHQKIAKSSYLNLGRVFGEMCYLRFASPNKIKKKVEIENPEMILNLLSQKKGVIAVSAHFSNWEWMAMGGAPKLGGGFYIVVKNIATKFTEQFLQKMRIRTGNILIASGDVRGMFKVLKEGKLVALLSDQAAPNGSVRVPFFGTDTPTFEGPARMALRTRAAMVFVVCLPTDNSAYRLIFTEIPYNDLPDESDESVKELTARHVRILEEYIRQYPSLWLWQHRRWKNV
jgi:KDO2-lipid IV(A) lauroyltransferase